MELHATPIRSSMPDKGFAGVCSLVGLGHNTRGKSLKTSLFALSKDQVSISESEPESFVERCKVCSGGIVWTLVISAGCRILGFCAACGLCLLPYLKCPQRRLYSAWKIADIYLRRSAEYWEALSASLRKLEIFSVRTSAIFPYAGRQLSAERSADICGHLCGRLSGRPHGLVRTSAWTGADVRMDWCRRTSAWMGADVCGSPHGWVRTSAGPEDLLRVAPPAV